MIDLSFGLGTRTQMLFLLKIHTHYSWLLANIYYLNLQALL
jgi:hypothetical protein